MAYPKQTVAFSSVKRIINDNFKLAIDEAKEEVGASASGKILIDLLKRFKNNLLENIKMEIL